MRTNFGNAEGRVQMLFAAFLCCVLCSSCNSPTTSQGGPKQTQQGQSQPQPCTLVTDLPFEPNDKEFKFQIWLDHGSTNPKPDTANVFIYENPSLTYDPSEFTLTGNKPQNSQWIDSAAASHGRVQPCLRRR